MHIQNDLEKNAALWNSNISANVNPKLAQAFQPSTLPDGRLKVTCSSQVDMGGGLVSRKVQIPQLIGCGQPATFYNYLQFGTNFTIPGTSMYEVARFEFDYLAHFLSGAGLTTPPANRANLSCQWNGSSGHLEIDASAGAAHWQDIGDGPGMNIAADVEHSILVKASIDYVAKTRSVLSLTVDGKCYPVPAQYQNIGWQASDEVVNSRLQKQMEVWHAGSADCYYRGTFLHWNDQPF